MTQSYTPRQIADGLLAGEFTRNSAFVPLAEVERLREALRDIERGDYSDPMCERTPEQRAREAMEAKS